MTCSTRSGSRDILSKPLLAFFLFWLPAIAIGVTGGSHFHGIVRVAVWTVALFMGISCVVNATRCHRVHCYLTGPFFLAMAIATLLYGWGVLPLGDNGWNVLGPTILVGANRVVLPAGVVSRKVPQVPGGRGASQRKP